MAQQNLKWQTSSKRRPNAPFVAPAAWEAHRDKLYHMYVEQDMSLAAIMTFMGTEHSFTPSKRQYTLQLNQKWKFFKNSCQDNLATIPSDASIPVEYLPLDEAPLHLPVTTENTNASTEKGDAKNDTELVGSNVLTDADFDDLALVHKYPRSLSPLHVPVTERQSISSYPRRPFNPQCPALNCDACRQAGFATRRLSGEDYGRNTCFPTDLSIENRADPAEDEINEFANPSLRTHPVASGAGAPVTKVGVGSTLAMFYPSSMDVPLTKLIKHRLVYRLSTSDLFQINEAATTLAAARSYKDAFRLYSIVLSNYLLESTITTVSPSELQDAALNVVRTAKIPANQDTIAFIDLKFGIFRGPSHLWSPELCSLYSCIAVNLARHEPYTAERSCRAALNHFRTCDWHGFDRHRMLLITNLIAVTSRTNTSAVETLQQELSDFHVDTDYGFDLLPVLSWCKEQLQKGTTLEYFLQLDANCWKQAPCRTDLWAFERTALFCHLWQAWAARRDSALLTGNLPALRSINGIEAQYNLRPVEVFSILSVMIMSDDSIVPIRVRHPDYMDLMMKFPTRENLLSRLIHWITLAGEDPVDLKRSFLKAYTLSLNKESLIISQNTYANLVQEYVRRFIDDHSAVQLSEDIVNSTSSAPLHRTSVSPTMKSTPRSSLSDMISMLSLSQRPKSKFSVDTSDANLPSSAVRRGSSSSSSFRHRLGLSWSTRSFRSSLMDVDPRESLSERRGSQENSKLHTKDHSRETHAGHLKSGGPTFGGSRPFISHPTNPSSSLGWI